MDPEDRVTKRDRYQARAQLVAAIIGALIAGLLTGLLGGREWKERTVERDMAVSNEAVKQLQTELADRSRENEQLRSHVDDQDKEIRKLRLEVPQSHNVISDTSSAATPAPESTVVAVKEVAGIAFSLKRCRLSNSVVNCDFSVINHDKDRSLEICTPCYGNRSRLVDSEGNEYRPEAAYLGSGYTHRPKAVLASEVPLRAGIRFNGIQPGSKSIKLLEIGIRVGFAGDYQVQFNDIAFQ